MPEKAPRKFGKQEPHPSNVLRLVKALLLLAKGDLTLEDSQLEAAVKVAWVAEDTLKVTGEYKEKTRRGEKVVEGTTRQALWQLVEKTDTPLELPQRRRENSSRTKQQRQKDVVRNALDYLEYLELWKDASSENKRNTNENKRNTNTQSEIFTLTLKRDASLEENLGVVKQKLGLETSPLEEDAGTIPLSFWQGCCRKILPTQLSINPLLHGDGVVLTIEDIVPLELVERKQRPQQKDDFSPEYFQVQAPTEYEMPVEHNKFLAQVLETGDSLKNRDRKIAVIGEPGAGKTTLLQEIAKEVEGAGGLPIFVRLADLGGKTLKDYLLEDWLEEATGKRRISDDIQDDFVQQFNLGRVWLLLDGVDEIAGSSVSVGARHVVPLQMIASQLKAWVSEARIVLTCRLNVWDVGKNDLYAFEKYRIQQLSYPDAVGDFIRRFFSKAGEPTKGDKLIEKLERSQPRIRDLVKNPLRLTLLCRIWKRRQGELPQTKAELYKRFVETFYEWKDKPEIDQDKRQLLEQALGELAKNAIDKETTKFRLRESFVRQELDKFDKSLFDLACRVSWINNVGVAAENPDEPVYAFFHPTFQEYFAALAIKDWKYFLNHVPHNPAQGIYRIFEPQWKEVILLWLGQEEEAKEQKEELLTALVKFEDRCREWIFRYRGFYEYRAYLLAAVGIAEFGECTRAKEIVKQIVTWSFGEFNIEYQLRQTNVPHQIAQQAKALLAETHHPLVVTALIDLIHTSSYNYTRIEAAEVLGKIVPGHPKAITTLLDLIHNSQDEDTPRLAIVSLGKIGTGNPEVIAALVNSKHTSPDEYIRIEAAASLEQVAPGHPEAIPVVEPDSVREDVKLEQIDPSDLEVIAWLVNKVRSSPQNETDELNRRRAVEDLGSTVPGHLEAIKALIEVIRSNPDKNIFQEAVRSLGRIGKSNPEAIDLLIELSCKNQNWVIRWRAVQGLYYANTSHEKVINALIELIHTSSHNQIVIEAAQSLGQILQRYPFQAAVSGLKDCLTTSVFKKDFNLYLKCYEVLLHSAETMPYPAFHQAWHHQEGVGKTTNSDNQSLNQDD